MIKTSHRKFVCRTLCPPNSPVIEIDVYKRQVCVCVCVITGISMAMFITSHAKINAICRESNTRKHMVVEVSNNNCSGYQLIKTDNAWDAVA